MSSSGEMNVSALVAARWIAGIAVLLMMVTLLGQSWGVNWGVLATPVWLGPVALLAAAALSKGNGASLNPLMGVKLVGEA